MAVGPAVAQEGEGPSGTLTAATVEIDVGETTTVTERLEIEIESTGSGDSQLTAIGGTLWRYPDHEISGFSAEVDGESVEPTVERHPRYTELSVPVEGVSDGDTVSVTLTYEVSGPAGELKAPLWVPEFETGGTAPVVDMTVSLPDGQQVHGAAFPKIDSTTDAGSTLRYDMIHMPGSVQFTYGEGSGDLLTLDLLSTLAGLLMIGLFFGIWGAYRLGALGGGGEPDVAG